MTEMEISLVTSDGGYDKEVYIILFRPSRGSGNDHIIYIYIYIYIYSSYINSIIVFDRE